MMSAYPPGKDVTLTEMLQATAYYKDDDTFRWFTTDKGMAMRVTFGEIRRVAQLVRGAAP